MPLHRVVYCSRNLIVGTPATFEVALADILARSRRNNTANGITGGLLFSADCFAQVLEGPLDEVDETFERIQCDNRHGDVTVLRSEPIDGRAFAGWSMAYAGDASGGPSTAIATTGPASKPALGAEGEAMMRMLGEVVAREFEWLARSGRRELA